MDRGEQKERTNHQIRRKAKKEKRIAAENDPLSMAKFMREMNKDQYRSEGKKRKEEERKRNGEGKGEGKDEAEGHDC